MKRLYAGIFGALVPWKCIGALDLGSVSILIVLLYLKTVGESIYMERFNAGILEHWSLGTVSEH